MESVLRGRDDRRYSRRSRAWVIGASSRRATRKGESAAYIETVEARRLLSASVNGGLLTVTGTPQNDAYRVVYNSLTAKYDVSNNGVSEGSFAATTVSAVSISGGDGNDSIYTFNTPPVTINGGAGDDTITGPGYSNANQPAAVFGGDGDDTITCYKGADFIDAGAGNDTVDAG